MQVVVTVVICAIAVSLVTANELPRAVVPESHAVVLRTHCLDCHNQDDAAGGVSLDSISYELNSIESAELWQKVLGALNSGEMPPEDEPQPSFEQKAKLLEDLSSQLVLARKLLADTGGRITMRRLNRREYQNTIRALLGVDVDARDLPTDTSSTGFDTDGGSLFLSGDQFELYLRLARTALDQVVVSGSPPEPRSIHIEPEQTTNRSVRAKFRNYFLGGHIRARMLEVAEDRPPTDFGFPDQKEADFHKLRWERAAGMLADYVTLPEIETGSYLTIAGPNPQEGLTLPPDWPGGRYVLRALIANAGEVWNLHKTHADNSIDVAQQRSVFVDVGFQGQRNDDALDLITTRKVTGSIAKPQVIEIPFDVTPNGKRKIALRERQHNDRLAGANQSFAAQQNTGTGVPPKIWIDWLECEGPLVDQWPPDRHQAIFFRGPDAEPSQEYARQILTRFATRAFRGKTPDPVWIESLIELFSERVQAGDSFEQALKTPLSVVLASPSFLYLAEPVAERSGSELSPRELAIRLAYFLWSGPPDEELLRLAASGELTQPAVLAAQTDRLLADDRAGEFVRGFLQQWLHLERLEFFQFNPRLYPDFDESVKRDAREELFRTFELVLSDDLPIGTLLKSDFVVVNDLLADFYGIDGVKGEQFRKVKVPSGMPRGGFLGMAAVLAMGSDGERSSPVERGAWVMRKLLNDPPPPAPANVPQLSRHAGKLLSARELLEAHMEEAQCAQCHRKIDPIGYGLEHFDAAGRWRETEYTEIFVGRAVKKSKEHPIDDTGTLPDGTAFHGFSELRDAIAEREDAFARGFVENLIAYGLGRPYSFTDQSLADAMLSQSKSVTGFVRSLVQSPTFKKK